MAKNSFTFQTALKLNSSNFKKGVNDVKSALAGLKSSFLSLAGALGAGLGFTQFISQIKDTAVQLSVAKSVLENVSRVTKEYTDGVNKGTVTISNYAENLEFVKKLAEDYSQDLVSLIENFAQFHAACEKTNLDLEHQQFVFESLTKAAAFYHMSADRTKDMMTAITQMMSKGKVSAEELRRQLGNALPGAFNLMAAALGVTTAQLEDMMKKGQVISSEALPRFAAMLNTVTKNANFDSVQMSLNRLKNTWYEFVESTGAEGVFNNLVKTADALLRTVTNNISSIWGAIKGFVASIIGIKVFDFLKKRGDTYFKDLDNELKKATTAYNKHAREIEKIKEKVGVDKTSGAVSPNKRGGIISKADLDRVIAYNDELYRTQKVKNELYKGKAGNRTWMLDDGDLAKLKRANDELKKTQVAVSAVGKQSRGLFTTIGAGIKSIGIQVLSVIKSIGITAIASAIIAALAAIYNRQKEIKKEQERINNIVNDYQTAVQQADVEVEKSAILLRGYLRTIGDVSKSETERLLALKEINKLMGTNYSAELLKTQKGYEKITAEVGRWIEATKLQAKVQVQATKAAEAQAEIERLKVGLTSKETQLKSIATAKGRDDYGNPVYGAKRGIDVFKVNKLKKEIELDKQEIVELGKVVDQAEGALDALGVKMSEVITVSNQDVDDTGKEQTNLEKTFDKYNKELQELDNKLREHAITQEQYNEDFDELVTKFWEEAAGSGQMSIEKILDKMDKGKTLTRMEQWYKDLYDAAQKAAFNTTLRAASDAIEKATDEAIAEADKEINEALDEWADKMEKNTKADIDALLTDKPRKTKRDSTFDYNKSKSTIQGEQLDASKDYIKDLEDAINTIVEKYDNLEDAAEAVRKKVQEWRDELGLAKKEAATLEEAMKLSKIQEDIDEFKKSINEAAFSGVKNLASSLDRCVKGVENLRTVFEDTDSTGWEQFMAIFNEIVQIIETIMSAYQTMMTIQDATAKMEEAEIALVSTKIALLEKELLLRQALSAQKTLDVKQTEQQAAANVAEAATAKASASAKAGEAIAGATASGAKLAFPYNLVAIAAGIAAVLAALASMSKFANGGIVGGNSWSGDKQMARVNSGEMVLNRQQQRTLWDIVNGKSKGSGGEVQFKIRGADLIGAIENYNSRRRG